jgi:membrane protein YqaA with SNARE-associated domain
MPEPKKTDKRPKKYRSRDKDKYFGAVMALVAVAAVVLGGVLYVLTGDWYRSAASIAVKADKTDHALETHVKVSYRRAIILVRQILFTVGDPARTS